MHETFNETKNKDQNSIEVYKGNTLAICKMVEAFYQNSNQNMVKKMKLVSTLKTPFLSRNPIIGPTPTPAPISCKVHTQHETDTH